MGHWLDQQLHDSFSWTDYLLGLKRAIRQHVEWKSIPASSNIGTFSICHISTHYFSQHTKLTLIIAVTCHSCSCGPNRKTKWHSKQPVRISQLSLNFVNIFACVDLIIFVTSIWSTPRQDCLHALHVTHFSDWSVKSITHPTSWLNNQFY
jgi:hypothetical protein